MEQDIYDALSGYGALTALATGGIYQGGLMPQNATNAVSIAIIGTTAENELSGDSGADRLRVQVDSYARTFEAAKAIATQVRAAMVGAAFSAWFLNEIHVFEDQTRDYRIIQDFSVWNTTP